jgi:hypothetical protein
MSTLGSLMLALRDPGIKPYNEQELTANRIQYGNLANQTQLLTLQDLQRQQEAAAMARSAIQQDPRLGGFGGGPMPTLASLGPMDGGGAPLTQQSFGPGGVGATQTVPGGMDLSRFATGQAPGGGPVLASVGQPQAPMDLQARLEAMARINPDAARLLQQQMQAQEDAALKSQENRLLMGEKVMENLGRRAQSVTDQAGLDAMRTDLQQSGLGKYAAHLPQYYSKEAMQALSQQALSVKDRLLLEQSGLKTQAEIRRLGLQGRPDIINTYLESQGVDPATATAEQVRQAIAGKNMDEITTEVEKYKRLSPYKLEEARQTGAAQAGEQPLDDPTRQRVTAYRRGEQLANQLLTEFTPEERAKFVGMGGMRMTGKQIEAWLTDATKRQADPRFARFLTLLNEAKTEAFATGGKALTQQEAGVVFGYIPTGAETSVEQFEQKLTQARSRSSERLDEEIKLATTPKRALAGERTSGTLARPSGGQRTQTTGTGGKVSLETLAQYAAKHNLPIGQVIKDAYAKGLEIE